MRIYPEHFKSILLLLVRETKLLWQKTVEQAEILEITQPSRPRKRGQPAKLFNEKEVFLYDEVSDLKTCYKRIYSDAIDAKAA